MLIGGLEKLTLIDFLGKMAATVFTIGCNFRCPYCYNSELVLLEKIKQHPQISEDDFFDFLEERRNFLEGVCVTGGEPTLQADLPEFLAKIKKFGYAIKLDTNGSKPKILASLIKKQLVDYIAVDIKAPIGTKTQMSNVKCQNYNSKVKTTYQEIMTQNIGLEKIIESINLIRSSGLDYEFRTTAVPELLTPDDFLAIAKWLKGSKKYYIQQFRPEKTLSAEFINVKPYDLADLQKIRDSIKDYFEICEVRY